MKIRVTEIECNADELRQSNTMAESFTNLLRGCFNFNRATDCTADNQDEEEWNDDDE